MPRSRAPRHRPQRSPDRVVVSANRGGQAFAPAAPTFGRQASIFQENSREARRLSLPKMGPAGNQMWKRWLGVCLDSAGQAFQPSRFHKLVCRTSTGRRLARAFKPSWPSQGRRQIPRRGWLLDPSDHGDHRPSEPCAGRFLHGVSRSSASRPRGMDVMRKRPA